MAKKNDPLAVLANPYGQTPESWEKWKKDTFDPYKRRQAGALNRVERQAKEGYSTFRSQARDQLTQAVQQLKSATETDALRRGLARSTIHGAIVGSETERMEKEIGKQTDAAKFAMDKTLSQVKAGRVGLTKNSRAVDNIDNAFIEYKAVNVTNVKAVADKKETNADIVGRLVALNAPDQVVSSLKTADATAKATYGTQDVTGYNDVKKKVLAAYGLKEGQYDPASNKDTLGNRLYWAAMGTTNSLVNSLKADYDVDVKVASAKAKQMEGLNGVDPTITDPSVFSLTDALKKKGILTYDPKNQDLDTEKMKDYFDESSVNKSGLLGLDPKDEKGNITDPKYVQVSEKQWNASGYQYDEKDKEDVERRARGLPPKTFLREYSNSEEDQKRRKEGKLPVNLELKQQQQNFLVEYNYLLSNPNTTEDDLKDFEDKYKTLIEQSTNTKDYLQKLASQNGGSEDFFNGLLSQLNAGANSNYDGLVQDVYAKNKALNSAALNWSGPLTLSDVLWGETQTNDPDVPIVIHPEDPMITNGHGQKVLDLMRSGDPLLPNQNQSNSKNENKVSQYQFSWTDDSIEKDTFIHQSTMMPFHLKETTTGGFISNFVKPPDAKNSQTGAYLIMPIDGNRGAYLTFVNTKGEQSSVMEYFLSMDDAKQAAGVYADQYKQGGTNAVKPINQAMNEAYTDKLFQSGETRNFIPGVDDDDMKWIGWRDDFDFWDSWRSGVFGNRSAEDEKKWRDQLKKQEDEYVAKYHHLPPTDMTSRLVTDPLMNNPMTQGVASFLDSFSFGAGSLTQNIGKEITGEDSDYSKAVDALLNVKGRQPYAVALGDMLGMIVPVAALENAAGKVISNVPRLTQMMGEASRPIINAAVSGGASFSTYSAVKDAAQGKPIDQIALNFVQNFALGAAGNAGFKMLDILAKTYLPAADSLLYNKWVSSGRAMNALDNRVQMSLAQAAEKEIAAAANKMNRIGGKLLETPRAKSFRLLSNADQIANESSLANKSGEAAVVSNTRSRITGSTAKKIAADLKDAGYQVKKGDYILVTTNNGRVVDIKPYNATLAPEILASKGRRGARVFQLDGVGYQGGNPMLADVTNEILAAELSKIANQDILPQVAGKEGAGGEHIVSFSDIVDDVTEGKDLFRGDDLLYSSKRPNGISKSYVNSSGDLMPANVEGMYHGREVTVIEHVLGGFRKGAKTNSPYTSFSSDQGISNKYGDSIIKVDLARLGNDIRSGKIKDVEILSPQQVLDAIKSDIRESSYWKNFALKWAQRDNEYLIKGVIPQEYITIK